MINNESRPIKLFLTSQFFSILGSTVVDYVLVWYITLKTGSGIALSLSLLVTFLPKVFAAFIMKTYHAQWNLRKVLIGCDALIGLISCLISISLFFFEDNYVVLLTMMAIRSLGAGIQNPCKKTYLAQITSPEYLLKVNSYNSIITAVCSLVAPSLGGIIASVVSIFYGLLFDPFTAILAIWVLCQIKDDKNSYEEIVSESDTEIKMESDSLIHTYYAWHVMFSFFIVPMAYLTPLLVANLYPNEVSKLALNDV